MKQFSKFYQTVSSIASRGMELLTSVRTEGLNNLPEDGCVVAANHYSEFDSLVVMKSLIDNGVPVRVLAKAPLFKVPILGWMMRKTGQVPVYRGTGQAKDALGHAKAALDDGETVMIFPEGTLTRSPDYWPMTAKTGVGRLALAGYKIVPCAQWGALDVMGRYDRRIHFGRGNCIVRYGSPIDFSDLKQMDDTREAVKLASERVIDRITEMLEDLRGDKAPVVRYDMKTHGDPGKAALGRFSKKQRGTRASR